jgi:hypothetical protein
MSSRAKPYFRRREGSPYITAAGFVAAATLLILF